MGDVDDVQLRRVAQCLDTLLGPTSMIFAVRRFDLRATHDLGPGEATRQRDIDVNDQIAPVSARGIDPSRRWV
jgi:hypothetical protein